MKKRFLSAFMVLVMCFTLLPAKKIVTMADDNIVWIGKGTKKNPYKIKTAEDLKKLAELVNAGNTYENEYFKLMNDIDLCGDFLDPIGGISSRGFAEKGVPFNGVFDGDWHKISNFHIFEASNNDAGLFGWIGKNGIVKNLTVKDSKINGGFNVGGIAGLNYGIVTFCCNENTYVNGGNSGGIVGFNDYEGVVEYCDNTGTISGTETSGGIVGINNWFALVKYCNNFGYVLIDGDSKFGDEFDTKIGRNFGYYESWD